MARYPARTPIKDKDWPTIMQRALKTVQENKQLQGYDVVPSTLTEQYKLMGWLQVLASCTACALTLLYTAFSFCLAVQEQLLELIKQQRPEQS